MGVIESKSDEITINFTKYPPLRFAANQSNFLISYRIISRCHAYSLVITVTPANFRSDLFFKFLIFEGGGRGQPIKKIASHVLLHLQCLFNDFIKKTLFAKNFRKNSLSVCCGTQTNCGITMTFAPNTGVIRSYAYAHYMFTPQSVWANNYVRI